MLEVTFDGLIMPSLHIVRAREVGVNAGSRDMAHTHTMRLTHLVLQFQQSLKIRRAIVD